MATPTTGPHPWALSMKILEKNLLILASAGSGKTFQLANRVIGLVAQGQAPEKIVALTFTRKAAGEFADSVLTRLANATDHPAIAEELRTAFDLPNADFNEALARVVTALPSFTLGTMDGFFARIIRGFQYELGLTGGRFDLLEGPRAAALEDDMLTAILGNSLTGSHDEAFFYAFRRATVGSEAHHIAGALRQYVQIWHDIFLESSDLIWGPETLIKAAPTDWEKQKSSLADSVRKHLDDIPYTYKTQRTKLEEAIGQLESHVTGSGSLGSKTSTLLTNILAAVASSGPLTVKSNKDFTIPSPAADILRDMVQLAADSEFAAALARTRAIHKVISIYNTVRHERLIKNGLLSFNDVKTLMGDWAHNEEARLRREAVDFRLDSRTDHWLLDEFQDTSRADWNGLAPLVDEAISDDQRTVFIVGDRKQAIYAWRGGDVGLFDEITHRYKDGLTTMPMSDSWRSCPQVLALVNRVCGDTQTMSELFGNVANRWVWNHHVSAPPLTDPKKRGEARVEMIDEWEDKLDRLSEILTEIGIGQKPLTCGVLLRGNEKAREVAAHLRTRGFDVIEEGRRQPALDNPVGLVMLHLLKWLADPADTFSRGVIEMSPLNATLERDCGHDWRSRWTHITQQIANHGFTNTFHALLIPWLPTWSTFGQRRAADLLESLAAIDASGGVSIQEAANWLERLEIQQSPGIAAVQVMTIHKSKGLGFDVVILPEIPDDSIPQSQYFKIARDQNWITETPPKWVRALIPTMRDASANWEANQRYEAFCMLYVAITRAKRGLYILLSPPAKSANPDKPSLSNWLIRSLSNGAQEGVIYQEGDADWVDQIPITESTPSPVITPTLGPALPRQQTITPSTAHHSATPVTHSLGGQQFGQDVHALLESISWLDDCPWAEPHSDAARAVTAMIKCPDLNWLFYRNARHITLLREQAVAAQIDGHYVSGNIDRLHLHHSPTGEVDAIDIIDFKTDAVDDPAELITRHRKQLDLYRKSLAHIHPQASIRCALVSVPHTTAIFI